jgi:hypothetical protein
MPNSCSCLLQLASAIPAETQTHPVGTLAETAFESMAISESVQAVPGCISHFLEKID